MTTETEEFNVTKELNLDQDLHQDDIAVEIDQHDQVEEIPQEHEDEGKDYPADEAPTPMSIVKIRRKKKQEPKPVYLKGAINFAKKFSSTGAAFILATLGVVTQTFHNGFLAYELSSFADFYLRLFQAIIAAFFLSGALLYFTIRSAAGIESAKKLVWYFAIFEVICNLYYWANKLIILEWNTTTGPIWSSMLIAVPFAFMIPWTIKAYASEINIEDDEDDLIDEYEEFEVEVPSASENIDELVRSSIDAKLQADGKNTIKYGDQLDFSIATIDDDGKKVNKILKATLRKNK